MQTETQTPTTTTTTTTPAPTGLFDDAELLAALTTACRLAPFGLTKAQSHRRTDADADTFGDAWDAYLDLLACRIGCPGLLARPGKWNKPQLRRLTDTGLFGLSADCLRGFGAQSLLGEPGASACAFLTLGDRLQAERGG